MLYALLEKLHGEIVVFQLFFSVLTERLAYNHCKMGIVRLHSAVYYLWCAQHRRQLTTSNTLGNQQIA